MKIFQDFFFHLKHGIHDTSLKFNLTFNGTHEIHDINDDKLIESVTFFHFQVFVSGYR